MDKIKSALLDVLHAANETEGSTAKMIVRELGSIATRYFNGDRTYTDYVSSVVKGRKAVNDERMARSLAETQQATSTRTATGTNMSAPGKWTGEWVPGAKKVERSGQKIAERAAAVKQPETATVDSNDGNEPQGVDLSTFKGMSEQDILQHFGTSKALKEYARELALPLKYSLNAADFTEAFISHVDHVYGTEPQGDGTDEEE